MIMPSPDLSLLAKKRARRSATQIPDASPRSFYHLAAALAHPDEDSLVGSALLESDYQDCLFSFVARGERLHPSMGWPQVMKALNKLLGAQKKNNFDQPKLAVGSIPPLSLILDQPEQSLICHGLSFSPQEIAALLVWAAGPWLSSFTDHGTDRSDDLSAADFHHELTTMAQRPNHRPFWFCATINSRHMDILLDRATLFSANRLIKKSWQIRNGAEPGIRYYHAALRASSLPDPLDVLYWLKLDEGHQIIEGKFINNASPHRLSCPITALSQWARKQEGSSAELVREIIDIYLGSLGVL